MRLGWVTGLILIVPALAWIAFELGLWPNAADKYAQCKSSAVAGGDDLGGPFELINTNGQTVTDKDIITEPSLVYFGYTYCPDVCPTLLADLDRFQSLLDETGRFTDLTIWFYSVDPARDSVVALANYVPWFDPRFVGLRAEDAEQAQRFEQGLGIHATITGTLGEADYEVAHGFRLYLLDAEGQLRAALAPTRNRAGQQYYEPPVLLEDYLALRRWADKQS